ncbi:MAG: DUF3310 domain-containing protein [Gammaproteobacteria bacterium]|nr:DUF3310 domain-containing protein [Gammaproteobacteria bacterium]
MKHPLLNPKSLHYQHGTPTIQEIESQMGIYACIGFAKGNMIKYKSRLDHKGQKEADLEKLQTYQNYLQWLLDIEEKVNASSMKKLSKICMPVSTLCEHFGIEIDYAI